MGAVGRCPCRKRHGRVWWNGIVYIKILDAPLPDGFAFGKTGAAPSHRL